MTVSSGASTVFGWFVNLMSVVGFIGWGVINCTYLRFCKSPSFAQEAAGIHAVVQTTDTRSRDSTGWSSSTTIPFNHISRGGLSSGQHSSLLFLVSGRGLSGIRPLSLPTVSLYAPSVQQFRVTHPLHRQISTSPSSLLCISATRSSRRPRSANGARWTSSPAYRRPRRRKFQNFLPGIFGRRSLRLFSRRTRPP